MSSIALVVWRGDSAAKLDALGEAHARVGGADPARRRAAEQLNASVVVQIAAHFQLFCRNVHTETASALEDAAPANFRPLIRTGLSSRRVLDRGNARARAISEDFRRFGLDIWVEAVKFEARTRARRVRLEQLNTWRDAVAHQDFAFNGEQRRLLAGTSLTVAHTRAWRAACDGLARTFDRTLAKHIQTITGTTPW